jgi:hypothetical protein
MRLTVRHHFHFGADRPLVGDDLVRAEAWDALRTRTSGPFAIARDREELERTADSRPEIGERARAINTLLEQRGVRTLASYGVGGAVVELWLHRLAPELRLHVTDYGPETVARLPALLPEAEVVRHDLLADPPLKADLHLFHRIDTELTSAEWREVLERFAHETVLVVATEVADVPRILREVIGRLRTRGLTRAGWLRSREAFETLWRPTHDAVPMRFHDLDGWLLQPRRRPRADAPA